MAAAERRRPPDPGRPSEAGRRRVQLTSDGGDSRRAGPVAAVDAPPASPGRALDPVTADWFGVRFGHDLGGVRIHLDDTSTRSLHALAYTSGNDVVVRPGHFAPATPAGSRLLAHELAHVVQQRAAPTTQESGAEHEVEADRAAEAVTHGARAPRLSPTDRALQLQRDPGARPEPIAPESALPTSLLVDLALARLDEIGQSGMPSVNHAIRLIRKELTAAWAAEVSATDTPAERALRLRLQRLLGFLASQQPVFFAFASLANPANYPAPIAKPIATEVARVAARYSAALLVAYSESPNYEALLAQAEASMKALPGFIVDQLLGSEGLSRQIFEIGGLLLEIQILREKQGSGAMRGRLAEELIDLDTKGGFGTTTLRMLSRMLSIASSARRADDPRLSDILQGVMVRIQAVSSIATALAVYEQFSYWVQELDNLLNKAVESIADNRLRRAVTYRDKADEILRLFEKDRDPFSIKFSTLETATTALQQMLGSKEFAETVTAIEERLETLATVRFVGKLALITAAAAFGAGIAAGYAQAGLLAAGASEGVAATGAFVAQTLAFTTISRAGQIAVAGKAEGSFWSDLAWNAAMFGALKGANAAFTKAFSKVADPRIWKTSFVVGKAGTALISLQGFAILHHRLTKDRWMSSDELVASAVTNVVLFVALEAGRFITEPLSARLTAPALRVKFEARYKALGERHAELKAKLDRLTRGELKQDELEALLNAIQAQWTAELRLLSDAAQRKVIQGGEAEAMAARYAAKVNEIQLRLSKLGVGAPVGAGPSLFQPVANGVVAFLPEGLKVVEDFYKQSGGTLAPSSRIPGALEGRLPGGDLTFYVPHGTVPKGLLSAQALAGARDAAQRAAKVDPLAGQGWKQLTDAFGTRKVDEILARVPADQMEAFLRAMADPRFSDKGTTRRDNQDDFFNKVAANPGYVRFARRWGADALVNLFRRFAGRDRAKMIDLADQRLAELPAGDAEMLLGVLRTGADAAALATALGKPPPPKAKVPRVTVTRGKLPVDRTVPDWQTSWLEARRQAQKHGHALTDEQLADRADLEQFFSFARKGRFRKFGAASKVKWLDLFDALAKTTGMPQSWINAKRGNLSEALLNPLYGKAKPVLKAPGTTQATIPDYHLTHSGFTEWVNQKSDVLQGGGKDAKGAWEDGKARARSYRDYARDVAQPKLPPGDRYSLDFVRDPGAETRAAMLEILFAPGSVVYRVKFGDHWYSR